MNHSAIFKNKIIHIGDNKQSKLVLAIDPPAGIDRLSEYVSNIITKMSPYICAIKLNFHVILPLSGLELQKLITTAHNENTLVIADLKLNDIFSTNQVAIQYLSSMGFDCVIVNPFIGKDNLKLTVDFARSLKCGVICLVYMSHEGAEEGFGASIMTKSTNHISSRMKPFYHIFYDNSVSMGVDGIVVGGNRLEILQELSQRNDVVPIYSPGIITQGGNIQKALEAGSDYLIVGRHILYSKDPLSNIQQVYSLIKEYL